MCTTGSQPRSSAAASTTRVAWALVPSMASALRGSRLKIAAAWTTASQPSSARATEPASSTSPVTTSSAAKDDPVRVERLGHLLGAAYDEPDVVAVSQQGEHDVRADVPGSARDQNAHA